MKTTLELPDELYRQAEALAALKGQSMKEWLTLLLWREIGKPAAVPAPDRQQEIEAFNRALDRLASLVGEHWEGERDAVAAIREQRRGQWSLTPAEASRRPRRGGRDGSVADAPGLGGNSFDSDADPHSSAI